MREIFNKDNVLLFNGDCFEVMNNIDKIDIVLTSPPYATSRNRGSIKNWERRYDVYTEFESNEQYIDWSVDLFNRYDNILNDDGVILYNISYGSENPTLMWMLLGELCKRTNFMIADTIVWKKKSALPNNVSPNKLTRITEFVFVICRKSEYATFRTNKKVKSVRKGGQKYYENIYNFIEARNNDGACDLNKATFSSELCEKLLDMYAVDGARIFDSFMGTGTTAVACIRKGMWCVGSELSEAQCEFAVNRIEETLKENK